MADVEFEKVYSDYYQSVYSYALRLTHDPELAQEVTQEAFFKAMKSIGGFRGQCRLQVWLCQIVKNTWFSMLEKQKRAAPAPEDDWPASAGLEDRFADKETALQVHQVLHRLEEPYREVFWLRALGELNFAQIAGLFGKTESWARVTYHRAKMKIKEELEKEGWG